MSYPNYVSRSETGSFFRIPLPSAASEVLGLPETRGLGTEIGWKPSSSGYLTAEGIGCEPVPRNAFTRGQRIAAETKAPPRGRVPVARLFAQRRLRRRVKPRAARPKARSAKVVGSGTLTLLRSPYCK